MDAQFSIPYTVAAAIQMGRVFIDEMNEQVIKDSAILDLAERVTPVLDPERQSDLAVGSVVMEIITRSGDVVTLKSEYPKGNPKNPAIMADCVQKLRDCAQHSWIPFSQSQIDRIVENLDGLERLHGLDTGYKELSLL